MTDCIISGKHHTQKNLAAKEVLEIEGETVRTEHKFGERKNCLKIKQKKWSNGCCVRRMCASDLFYQ
jgi:hypothetical protein